MIRVDAVFSDRLEHVKITGDFFLHPEETLEHIEASLEGAALPIDRSALAERIAGCLKADGAELIGAAPEDFVVTLAEAVQ
jgi:lipoate-protein ligase A